jgi:hypothetical protein
MPSRLQPPPLQPRRTRPLPPAAELLASASACVLSWARQRVRDDLGLEKLLHEAALVSWGWWDAVQHGGSFFLPSLGTAVQVDGRS